MSNKAYCPACDVATSNITAGFQDRIRSMIGELK